MSQTIFEKAGGYVVSKEVIYPFQENVNYMDCTRCHIPVRNVGETATSVVCSRCLMGQVAKQFPESMESIRTYKPTGRPAGWHWMAEFVDKDGNVFHKGKEVKKLKGTLKPTKAYKPRRKCKRLPRTSRKTNSKKGQAEVRMNFYNDGENEGDWIEQRKGQFDHYKKWTTDEGYTFLAENKEDAEAYLKVTGSGSLGKLKEVEVG